jgi:hypothetical protein
MWMVDWRNNNIRERGNEVPLEIRAFNHVLPPPLNIMHTPPTLAPLLYSMIHAPQQKRKEE